MDAITNEFNILLERCARKEAIIGIIGLGYVGIPLALVACTTGFQVIGFDVDAQKVRQLKNGQSYINHIGSEEIATHVRNARLRVTGNAADLGEADAILICVPTPLTKQRDPDLRFIEKTGRTIASLLRRNQLVVLESTTYPGTTCEFLKPILEENGLICGKDFYLGFSPEREDPGNTNFATQAVPKVIGGEGGRALRLMAVIYGLMFQQVVPVSSTQTAEAVKLTENIFRSVNIALVNELKVIYDAMSIDVWEVIEAAKTKPFGYMPFYPGPGLGGHCIPVDPFYLSWKAREFEINTRFIELAGEINAAMPQWVMNRLIAALDNENQRGLKGARILLVGLAYKKNVDDIRESPSLRLIEMIERRGATVDYYDPYIPVIPSTREHSTLAGRRSIDWEERIMTQYDAVLIATDHDNVDYSLLKLAKLVVDTRNVCARNGVTAVTVVKA